MAGSPPKKQGWQFSYRQSLIFAVPLLVAGTGILIALPNYLNTRSSIEQLARSLFREVSTRTATETRFQISQAAPVAEMAKSLLAEEARKDSKALQEDLLIILRTHPEFTYVAYSDANGSFTGALHAASGAFHINLRRIENGKSSLDEFDVDTPGKRALVRHVDDTGYDPRKRPFYQLAAAERRRIWTPPYIFYEAGVPGITCATPVFDSAGAVAGVFSIDIDFNRLSQLVAGLKPTTHGRVFIYADDGTVLAHPTMKLVEGTGQRGQGKLLTVRDIPDPLVQQYTQQLADPGTGSSGTFTFEHDGERYYASNQSFEVDKDVTWRVGAFAPESDFMGHVRRNSLIIFGLSMVGVLIALVLSVLLGTLLAGDLDAVAHEMDKVGQFRLDDHLSVRSRFREITVLSRTLETMKGGLRSFASYVPRDLVRAVIASGHEAKLEGTTQELSIFFSDIASFTSFAESMKPDMLVERLGVYLEEMTRIIGVNHGTVDKFIGDGIMAFWGAPEVLKDHAACAAVAALECQKRLAELRKDPQRPWMNQLYTRIGISTGEVLVGNIGTPERMNYTVMGDTVNLASRLEGLSKAYGTSIIVSESTFRAARERVVGRPLDVVAVKGKALGIRVYELLALTADADDTLREVARLSEAALDAYLKRDFAGAGAGYQAILKLRPGDKAATLMAARCQDFAKAPPPAEWNGVHQVHEK